MEGLHDRIVYALMTIDNLGFLNYSKSDFDILIKTHYYFNYLISLYTGIFDNLAIITYEICDFDKTLTNSKISLSKTSGKEFLKEIKDKYPDLHQHIESMQPLIRLIYCLRELVIHREGFSKRMLGNGFSFDDHTPVIPLRENSNEIKNDIHLIEKKQSIKQFRKWGLIVHRNKEIDLHPYSFAITSIEPLVSFVEEYLEIITRWYEKINGKPLTLYKKLDDQDVFNENHIGF